jgi:hypothetical protein
MCDFDMAWGFSSREADAERTRVEDIGTTEVRC